MAFAAVVTAADDTHVTFYGAAECVGGSCAIVERGNYRLMIDCGTFYGDEGDPQPSADKTGFGVSPCSVSDLVVTHAHADHAGRVPQFVRSGFKGSIWMTEPTRRLLEITWASQMLYDDSYSRNWRWSGRRSRSRSCRVHWRPECEWRNKISPRNLREFTGTYSGLCASLPSNTYATACSVCCQIEVDNVMSQVRTIPTEMESSLGPFKVTLRDVKHLPGAVAVYVDDGKASCVFSGDLGTRRSRVVDGVAPSRKCDVVFVECTYGDEGRGDRLETEREYSRFRSEVAKSLRQGKLVWIPAFAMDRTQRVLLELAMATDEGLFPKGTKVFSLSSSGNSITRLYLENPQWFDRRGGFAPISGLKLNKGRFTVESAAGTPTILLSTAGMMDAGASLGLIPELMSSERTALFLVGYQAQGTPGRKFQEGCKEISVVVDGRTSSVPVRASVRTFGCFSGHADAIEIDEWLAANLKSRIYLIHGDKSALRARKSGLESRYGAKVEIVETGRRYVLGK